MKKGLVLEGGAMRGLFTAGVLDVFLEEGIEFDGAVGTSAGALFGCNYKSKQTGRTLRYNLDYCRDKRYGSFRNLLITGDYYSKRFCYQIIPKKLDPFDYKTYRKNPMEFYVTATDMERGTTIYHKAKTGGDRDVEWMRASASMPLFARVVKLDGYKLMDGGITDSIPLEFMNRRGYGKNVVVLTRPAGYQKKSNKLNKVLKFALKDYPAAYKAMKERHIKYNEQLIYVKKQEEMGSALVIQPPESLGISRIEKNPSELLRVYEIGRKAAKDKLEEIKEFLKD